MAAEYEYFYEDEVFRINKKGNIEFGMVLENAELVSSDENSDGDDDGRMKKGHIRVAWHPKGEEEVIPERKVGLADRSLMPGDVVRRLIKGKDTQRGYCRHVNVNASVQLVGTKQVIRNVDSANLTPLEDYSTDIAVCLDSWVGGIKMVQSKVTVRFPDGSKAILDDPDAADLDDLSDRKERKKLCFVPVDRSSVEKNCSVILADMKQSARNEKKRKTEEARKGSSHKLKEVDEETEKKDDESGSDSQSNSSEKESSGSSSSGWITVTSSGSSLEDSEFHHNDFYPGQVLWGPLRCFETAEWLQCTKELTNLRQRPNKNVRVTVESVRVVTLGVHWQCRAFSKEGAGSEKEQPKYLIQGEDLKRVKLLNVFEPCTLQVGDRNYYTFRDSDILITKEQWRRLEKELHFGSRPDNGPARPKNSPKRGEDNKTPVPEVVVAPPTSNDTADHSSHSSDQYEDIDTDEGSQSDTASISSGCSIGSLGKKKKGPALMTQVLKKKKLRRAKKRLPPEMLVVKPSDRLVVETLSTTSKADVVWQDGSIEQGIPSTQLFPIHHLDDQEFFPGDFVIENKDDSSTRVYGVVQSVEHAGRTAVVKWFRTYASDDAPRPSFLEENEVSVYDLKDHPDFQYRPGTVVIRVANFEGEDACCTAGQVLDNYPVGQVQVWWVDGHVSMCWPQDLYKVGEYDSDEGDLWDDGSSDASWETESEHSVVADENYPEDYMELLLRPKLAANIEKARIAMARLEEIFTQNPGLQTTVVMRQLLEVYKDCRYLDKLMGTSFFHESHFHGLLERVRERGRVNTAQRVAEQVSRLFHSCSPDGGGVRQQPTPDSSENTSADSGMNTNTSSNRESTSDSDFLSENIVNLELKIAAAGNEGGATQKGDNVPTTQMKKIGDITTKPSNKRSSCVSVVGSDSDTVKNSVDDIHSSPRDDFRPSHVCARLCALIKAQLVKAHAEVTKRFGGQASFNNANFGDSPESPDPEEVNPSDIGDTGQEAANGLTADPPPDVNSEIKNEISVSDDVDKSTVTSLELTSPVKENGKDDQFSPSPGINEDGFTILDSAPSSHKFKLTMFQPTDPKLFFRTVKKELRLLRTALPNGIWVKGFEDRMDLYSVMIRGPERTPYEDGLFFFDFQLSADYPKAPPVCHYVSYCSDRLNPNLYEDGKVCVSLLGTWSGKGTEVWTLNSNLLQVIVSIQGLILVSEPYFNEAGYEKQKGTQQGRENSRMYNEMVMLKLVQSTSKMLIQPPNIFKMEIMQHFQDQSYKLIDRLTAWLDISEHYNNMHPLSPTTPTTFRELGEDAISCNVKLPLPEFPLIPASKGFCITLRKTLVSFRDVLESEGIKEQTS